MVWWKRMTGQDTGSQNSPWLTCQRLMAKSFAGITPVEQRFWGQQLPTLRAACSLSHSCLQRNVPRGKESQLVKLNWKQPCGVLGHFWTAGYFTEDGGHQTGAVRGRIKPGWTKKRCRAHFSKENEITKTFQGWSFPTAQNGGNQHFTGTLESRLEFDCSN